MFHPGNGLFFGFITKRYLLTSMKKLIFYAIVLCAAIPFKSKCQNKQYVFTSDIDNFWIAFDSIHTTTDSVKQLGFIQTLYIDKGTVGLKAFMKARNYNSPLWIKLIRAYPKFWQSIRSNTLSVKNEAAAIESSIEKFKQLYPALKPSTMYFTIGGLRSGGTTTGNMVLIGAEIATGNAATDVAEFSSKWLAGVFREQSEENVVPLNIHEYVHTQQNGEGNSLLAQAITEGSCDFITELVIGKPMQTNYINYGKAHEAELKESFKKEMFSDYYNRWLYNGSNATEVADLGYFMGYSICKSYYNQATDKKQAIKNIIELNYADSNAVEAFLAASKYYTEFFDKAAMRAALIKNLPEVTGISPTINGSDLTDPGLRELTILFSKEMNPTAFSISMGKRGKPFYPIEKIKGFSPDNKSFTVYVRLEPNHSYEFIVTGMSFASKDAFPLKDNYEVKFKTK
jgi:hypothetical protein